jgi:membrane protease YdiL (CAAX protease family)
MDDDEIDDVGDRPRHPLLKHLSTRLDGLTSAVLVFPLFVLYQVGILSGRGQNGVDFLTRALIEVGRRDMTNYLAIMGVLVAAYVAVLVILRNRGAFHPRAFVPMLAEASVYALVMGSIILYVMSQFLSVLPGLAVAEKTAALDVLVISAGAGFHEELIFRLILMGGLAWLLTGVTGQRRAWLIALVVSSLAFSIAHHIGPAAEAFTFGAFVYRALAGAFFALVYQVRGFAVAVWTHALYDVYVLSM